MFTSYYTQELPAALFFFFNTIIIIDFVMFSNLNTSAFVSHKQTEHVYTYGASVYVLFAKRLLYIIILFVYVFA